MTKIKTAFLVGITLVLIMFLALRVNSVKNAESYSIWLDRELAREKGFLAAEYLPTADKLLIGDSLEFSPGSIWVHEPIKLKHRLFIFNGYYVKSPLGKPELKYTAGSLANGFMLTTARNDTASREQFFAQDEVIKLKTYTLDDELVDLNGNHFTFTDYTTVDTIKLYLKNANFVPSQPLDLTAQSDYILYKVELEREPIDSVLFVKSK